MEPVTDGNTTINMPIEGPQDTTPKVTWNAIILGIFLFLLMFVTITGNIMVFIAIAKHRRLRTPFNYFLVNLAVTDVSVGVVAMGFYTMNTILGYWPFGEFLCGLWIFTDYGMTFESIFTLVMISLDRVWAVTWTLHHKRHSTKRKAITAIIFSWIVMFALWLPAFIMERRNNKETDACIWEPSENKTFVIIIAVFGYHGPCLILLFCYIKVFIFMVKRLKSNVVLSINLGARDSPLSIVNAQSTCSIATVTEILDRYDGNDQRLDQTEPTEELDIGTISFSCETDPATESQTSNSHNLKESSSDFENADYIASTENTISYTHMYRQENTTLRRTIRKGEITERKVFITLTYIIVGYMVCWLPFHLAFDIRAANQALVSETLYTISIWMAYSNSTINPFLYNFSNVDFRNAFKKIICWCK